MPANVLWTYECDNCHRAPRAEELEEDGRNPNHWIEVSFSLHGGDDPGDILFCAECWPGKFAAIFPGPRAVKTNDLAMAKAYLRAARHP